MVLGHIVSPRWLSPGDSDQEGLTHSGERDNPTPSPRAVETVGLASEGAQLISLGLSTEVVETILYSVHLDTGNCTPRSGNFSLLGAEVTSGTQLTAQWVQCWTSCRKDSLQG